MTTRFYVTNSSAAAEGTSAMVHAHISHMDMTEAAQQRQASAANVMEHTDEVLY